MTVKIEHLESYKDGVKVKDEYELKFYKDQPYITMSNGVEQAESYDTSVYLSLERLQDLKDQLSKLDLNEK